MANRTAMSGELKVTQADEEAAKEVWASFKRAFWKDADPEEDVYDLIGERIAIPHLAKHRLASAAADAGGYWVMVPRVPTEAMLDAMHKRIRILCDASEQTADIQNDREVWSAILTAAPAPAADVERYYPSPWTLVEPADDNGAAYIRDRNGNAVAMLMWPGHAPEDEQQATEATYQAGRMMAAAAFTPRTSAGRERLREASVTPAMEQSYHDARRDWESRSGLPMDLSFAWPSVIAALAQPAQKAGEEAKKPPTAAPAPAADVERLLHEMIGGLRGSETLDERRRIVSEVTRLILAPRDRAGEQFAESAKNSRDPGAEAVREALAACRDQFDFYADEHQRQADEAYASAQTATGGDTRRMLHGEHRARTEKAKTNRAFADRARVALQPAAPAEQTE